MEEFVFKEDFEVVQPRYNGGDFPDGEYSTYFKKGQVVEGKYGFQGCEGAGCTGKTVVVINVNGQGWPVNTSILTPVNPADEITLITKEQIKENVVIQTQCYGSNCSSGSDSLENVLFHSNKGIYLIGALIVLILLPYFFYKKRTSSPC